MIADTLTALAVWTGAMAALGALVYYLRNYNNVYGVYAT